MRKGFTTYRIGTVARMLSVHTQTLRIYEREGLVRPERSAGNTRRYSPRDVERIETILWLTREMGVNLAGVEIILHLREQMEKMQREMIAGMEQVRRTMEKELKKKRGR